MCVGVVSGDRNPQDQRNDRNDHPDGDSASPTLCGGVGNRHGERSTHGCKDCEHHGVDRHDFCEVRAEIAFDDHWYQYVQRSDCKAGEHGPKKERSRVKESA